VRRTNSKFNKLVLKRLKHSRNTKRPVPLSKIVKILEKRDQSKKSYIACVVGPILNDNRMLEIPKIRVCALKISAAARKRIIDAGGEVYTFDQLATISPEGKGTILLRGNKHTKVTRRFGTPGSAGSHAVYVYLHHYFINLLDQKHQDKKETNSKEHVEEEHQETSK
jgi:large subunit ribosomal protein L18e